MTLGKQHIKRIGRWTAWVAAYALVFNVMLTTALVASISPVEFNARHQLCLNAVSTSITDDSGDQGKIQDNNQGKTIISCPLCVSGMIGTADIPPQSPALAIRIALHVPYETPDHDVVIVRIAQNAHQPRGPPHLN